jgi:hypothetical protein
VLANETETRGGSRDTEVKELAERPTITSSTSAATTAMPVGYPASVCLIVRGVTAPT